MFPKKKREKNILPFAKLYNRVILNSNRHQWGNPENIKKEELS